MKNTVVRPSPIDGKGLFAFRDFVEGETVESVTGYLQADWDKPSTSKYALMVGRKRTLILSGKCRFVNHSTEPNVQFKIGKKNFTLVALRNIKAGEELTSRYKGVFG